MKIVLPTLLLIVVATYLLIAGFSDDKPVSTASPASASQRQASAPAASANIKATLADDHKVVNETDTPGFDMTAAAHPDLDTNELTDENRQKSKLEQFLDGELKYELLSEGELYDYLYNLWDGTSQEIEEFVYTVRYEVKGEEPYQKVAIEVSKKLTENQKQDFKMWAKTGLIDQLIENTELGELSIQREDLLVSMAQSVKQGTVDIESLKCREKRCMLYVAADSEESFEAFSSKLFALEDGNALIMHSGDPTQAAIQVNFTH